MNYGGITQELHWGAIGTAGNFPPEQQDGLLSQWPILTGIENSTEDCIQDMNELKELLKIEVSRGFLTLWRKLHLHNSL
jgi:hypothetical protein